MKVIKTTSTTAKTTSEIDLFDDVVVPASAKDAVAQAVGEYLVEQTQIKLTEGRSPIAGHGKFKKLSKSYASQKMAEIGNSEPNLEYSGEMRDELTFKTTSKGIEIGVMGRGAGKADGHNNFSGDSPLPTRRFLPAEGELYSDDIQSKVKDIIADIVGEQHQFEKEDFENVETKSDLYSILSQGFQDWSRSEIRAAILRDSRMVSILGELLDLL